MQKNKGFMLPGRGDERETSGCKLGVLECCPAIHRESSAARIDAVESSFLTLTQHPEYIATANHVAASIATILWRVATTEAGYALTH
jgi:hypothetical protein